VSPAADRLALVRCGRGGHDRILLVDLDAGGAWRDVWSTTDCIDELEWSPAGDALAVTVDRGYEIEERTALLRIRLHTPPEVTPIEQRNDMPSSFDVAWDGDAPRLVRRL
jgi:dipeptidyl aminopeptidase/acylaminoacyl peptidase